MNRSTGIILGVLMAFASSVAATGSTPPGLPWVTATKQSKIKTNPSSSAAADASLLLDASSAGAGECMIGVDTATDVCLIDAEGDAAAASMAVVGTSSAATISATTALTLEETGAGTDAITLQAPASITAPYTLELPPDAGGAGECLQNTGTPGVLDFGACAAGAGDITAVGSMTSGAAFADSAADGDWLGLGSGAGRISFTDAATDQVNVESAVLSVGSTSPRAGSAVYGFGGFLVSEVNDYASIRAYAHGTAVAATNAMFSSRGTTASPTATQSGDLIGALQMGGYDGTSYLGRANIYAYASQNWSTGNHGTSLQLTTTATSTADDAIRMVWDQNGNVGVGPDTTPDTLLDVQGTFSCGTNGETSVDAAGNITTSGTITGNGASITAATAFLPDADLGAALGSSTANFSEIHSGAVYRGFHHAAGDSNYSVGANDYFVLSDEHDTAATVKYVILPTCNSGQKGRTIEAVKADNAAGSTSACTPQDAGCGATGTDSIINNGGSTVTSVSLGFAKTSLTCDGSGVWHD